MLHVLLRDLSYLVVCVYLCNIISPYQNNPNAQEFPCFTPCRLNSPRQSRVTHIERLIQLFIYNDGEIPYSDHHL